MKGSCLRTSETRMAPSRLLRTSRINCVHGLEKAPAACIPTQHAASLTSRRLLHRRRPSLSEGAAGRPEVPTSPRSDVEDEEAAFPFLQRRRTILFAALSGGGQAVALSLFYPLLFPQGEPNGLNTNEPHCVANMTILKYNFMLELHVADLSITHCFTLHTFNCQQIPLRLPVPLPTMSPSLSPSHPSHWQTSLPSQDGRRCPQGCYIGWTRKARVMLRR